jgi:hypothetical protein
MLANSNLSCSDYLTMVRVASSHYLTILAATAQFACPRHDASARLSNLAPYDRQYRSATRWCGGGGMSEISEDELFAMVNLVPRLTGLPMTVWVRPESGLPHDIRIKVNMTHGRSMSVGNLAVVGVRPVPRLIAGQLPVADMQAVSDWIRLNEAAIIDYWYFRIDTDEFLARMQPLSPPIPP